MNETELYELFISNAKGTNQIEHLLKDVEVNEQMRGYLEVLREATDLAEKRSAWDVVEWAIEKLLIKLSMSEIRALNDCHEKTLEEYVDICSKLSCESSKKDSNTVMPYPIGNYDINEQ